ncbi:CMRF35-like molecule 5 isoform X3 [Triplophysa rosa]|uniref:CMRF35-like molecule 5 isoform X3 n=1 Tax=Triplophysa rosa TaxID=992332 RepID=UPI002545CDBE|nr:CMRF35-like molecule 5 isoform X3 [Triplophysa rosa]
MKIRRVVCIWIFLTAEIRSSSTDKIETHGYTGKNLTVSCQHSWVWRNRMYFCTHPCKDEDVLVSSDRSSNGRFSLKYLGNGTFTVTITDLQESDSGIYWCGVDRVGPDTYHEVNLRVYKADTHTTLRTPTPATKSDPRTSTSTSFTPAPDDITNSVSLKGPVLPHTPEDQTFFDKAGHLMYTAVGLTVMLVILGVILYVYKKKKRKSHSSSGRTAADDERRTTITTEAAAIYEEIAETQQRTDPHTHTTVYSAVNHHSAAKQIQDSSLCSDLSIQPSCRDQTVKSNTDTVTYAAINTNKNGVPQAFRSEDTETYDTVFCS